MEITRHISNGVIELKIQGRLDGYWADHLDTSLAETVREGHHRIRLNLSRVTFMSSAGIAVLVKFYKQLTKIQGALVVASPSAPVRTVLEITRLAAVLIEPAGPATPPVPEEEERGQQFARDGAIYRLFEVAPGASLTWRAVGSDEPLRTAGFSEEHCVSLTCPDSLFAFGVGAFGEGFSDCRDRFGEFLSVAGAAAYQPADGTNVPDYLVASGTLAPELKVLYCLACEGRFARLVRFEATSPTAAVTLGDLATVCLELSGAPAAGMVIVAETAGLVGAALRSSPAKDRADADFFSHPGVRTRLTFTAERAFARTLTLAVGVAARDVDGVPRSQLRPLGGSTGLVGHFHAAAFSFRPLQKGEIDLKETVATLFDTEELLSVLHLVNDDRAGGGAGQSQFIRGACWMGGIACPS